MKAFLAMTLLLHHNLCIITSFHEWRNIVASPSFGLRGPVTFAYFQSVCSKISTPQTYLSLRNCRLYCFNEIAQLKLLRMFVQSSLVPWFTSFSHAQSCVLQFINLCNPCEKKSRDHICFTAEPSNQIQSTGIRRYHHRRLLVRSTSHVESRSSSKRKY